MICNFRHSTTVSNQKNSYFSQFSTILLLLSLSICPLAAGTNDQPASETPVAAAEAVSPVLASPDITIAVPATTALVTPSPSNSTPDAPDITPNNTVAATISPTTPTPAISGIINTPPTLAATDIIVVMDLHDTTFMPDYELVLDAWNSLPLKFKLKYFPKFLWQLTNYGWQKLFTKAVTGIEHQLIKPNTDPQYQQLITQTISGFKPMPGVQRLLTKLNQAGIKVCAFSNIGPLSYQLLSQKYPEICNQFAGRIILENWSTPSKSQPAAYQRCIAEVTKILGHAPTQIIFFDDSLSNLQLAVKTDPRFVPVQCQSQNGKALALSQQKLLQACHLTS